MSDPTEPRYPLVLVDATPDEVDALIGQLTLLGAEGIEERDSTTLSKGGSLGVTLVANFATVAEARAAVDSLGAHARLDEIVGDAWRDAWKSHWQPTRLGTRIVVVPTWGAFEPATSDLVMRLDPGRAFGTGQHASTALAAAALERRIAAGVRETVIDLGCGSGILSFAAVMLGAPGAIACDVDPDAIVSARENALALGLASKLDLRVGSVDVVTETSRLVVANIEAVVLIPLAAMIAPRVAMGGTLILSGILEPQLGSIVDAYRPLGFKLVGRETREGWVAPELTRAS